MNKFQHRTRIKFLKNILYILKINFLKSSIAFNGISKFESKRFNSKKTMHCACSRCGIPIIICW